jgi:lipopolysaccharide cholinephosphotransferase
MNNPKEESICGFTVTSKRKEVWQIELDMVKQFIAICKKYQLKYFVCGGTLLGAIRHNGFIPWDDDIDIMMPRKDYYEFLKVAQLELPSDYFLQYYKTEHAYANGHAQIRNNNTTCLLKNAYFQLHNRNCGVFIDIFPYDNVPADYKKRKKFTNKVAWLKKIYAYKLVKVQNLKSFIQCVVAALYINFHSIDWLCEKIDILSQKYNNKETGYVGLTSFLPGYEKNVWKKEWFNDIEYHIFQDIIVAIPKYYDEVLKTEYGDYMQIPENKNGTIHGAAYFDTKKSYKEYLNITEDQYNQLLDNVIL